MRWMALVSVVALLALGCGDDDDAPGNTAGAGGSSGAGGTAGSAGAAGTSTTLTGEAHPDCDVLSPAFCGFPFPSNYYLADDPTKKNPSGKRVEFGATTLPKYIAGDLEGKHVDPSQFYDQDGFSPGQGPLYFFAGATVTGLPTAQTIPDSLKADTSPTILIDTSTGELVPHFAELDMTAGDEEERALIIRPVVRLKDATRYVVAIRNVVDASGKAIEAVDAFKALRDRTPTSQNAIESRRAAYDDIFAVLDTAKVKRETLQIAWDYTTATRDNNTRRLVHMRDDALGKVGAQGPTYTVKSVTTQGISDNLKARVIVTMHVPLYLDSPDPGGKFVLGDDGLPTQQGEADYEVLLLIPKSIDTLPKVGILANGHGLLGDKDEGQGGYLAEMCNRHGYIGVAVDFIGFAHDDVENVVSTLGGHIGMWTAVVDRQHQGHLNGQLAMRMMRGRIATEGLKGTDGTVLIPPAKVDPAQAFYRGDSQGGIMGAVYMAISTDVTRGLLGEPGLPYNLLLNRSKDYAAYSLIMASFFSDLRDQQMVLGLIQMPWDRTEPDGYAPYITQNMLPNTPQHQILLHVAIGDYQVTPLGAHILARSVGAKNLSPVNRSIYGIPEDPGPFTGSGMVEYNFDLKDPVFNVGPGTSDNQDPHDTVRKLIPSYDQSHHFFQTGEIMAFCDGACDCQEVLASTEISDDNKASCVAGTAAGGGN